MQKNLVFGPVVNEHPTGPRSCFNPVAERAKDDSQLVPRVVGWAASESKKRLLCFGHGIIGVSCVVCN